ncbi:MAG: FAD-dependent oxidoreductase [Calditrichia bacterium]|nr:FAD-dependent oxidoreductase [Calditrichia bacterium]
MGQQSGYLVAIIGGGISGSEAAMQLSLRGISSILFEQSHLPYGKIEEGLPKWHIKLRDQEERKIDEKLKRSNICFVPGTSVGKDISLKQILDWGVNAVLLAIGAGRDRRLNLPGIDDFIGKGLYYQNEFVSWFNQKHEPGFRGPECRVADDALVIGGGLASLDVVKILMLETVIEALDKAGIEMDLFTLEREGLPIVFKKLKVSLSELGLKGCTLYYRRRISDMPLSPMPDNADQARKEKIYLLRQRILENYRQKYLFQVQPCYSPVEYISEGNVLQGLVFQKNEIQKGTWQSTKERKRVLSPLVISSVGSVPELLPEVPMEGNLLAIEDLQTGKLAGFDNVFVMGNAVTGRGNIRESLVHSREITKRIMNSHLQVEEEEFEKWVNLEEAQSAQKIEQLIPELHQGKPLSQPKTDEILARVRTLQKYRGYRGDYDLWIREHLPIRLESLLAGNAG